MEKMIKQMDRVVSGVNGAILVVFAGGFILLLGLIHYITNTEYALSLFFLFPIVFSTWYVGLKTGVGMAVFGALTWLVADLRLSGRYLDANVPFINESFRLIVFLFVAVLVWALKDALVTQKKIARTDLLTGMPNRLAFFEVAEREMSRARRFSYPLSIIYIDIDNFKFVNDTSGHAAGDRLLQVVSNTLMGNIREIDITARLGGDEVGILLVETEARGAAALAEKLQKKLDEQMLRHGWPVTFSMGVATFPNISISAGDMMQVADKLMYFAKEQGKNRIIHEVFVGRKE